MASTLCTVQDLQVFNTTPKMDIVTSFLNSGKKTLKQLPTYATAISGVTKTISVRSTNVTVTLVSIGDIIQARVGTVGSTPERYSVTNVTSTTNIPYVNAAQRGTLASLNKLAPIYTDLSATTIPGTTRRLILGNLKPVGTTLSTAKESVSYDLIYSLKYEFCFYTKILTTLMNDYVTVQQATSTEMTSDDKTIVIANIVNNMAVTRIRLNDLIELANYIAKTQNQAMSGLNEDINAFINSTRASVTALDKNAASMMAKDKEYGLRTRQLAYSEEKNAYANQLLAMYGFANLIALGLLFYIYKS